MKCFYQLFFALLLATSVSCSSDDTSETTPKVYSISGHVEKGPFVSGSTISIQPLNNQMQALGSMYNTTIKDNTGLFTFGSHEFTSPYAELTADGYFFNEVTGELSTGVLRLRSIVNLNDNSSINVNILTHLKHPRVLNLIAGGKNFEQANKEAQLELLTIFGLQEYADLDASQISISSGTKEAAALTAISTLLLYNRSEAELTEYLAVLSDEFGRTGSLSTKSMAQIQKDRNSIFNDLQNIESNIVNRYAELGLDIEILALAPFFDWDSDGEAGNELLKDGDSIKLSDQNITIPAKGGQYQISISSPIPLYLKAIIESEGPIHNITIGSLNLYEEGANVSMRCETSLEANMLSVNVAESQSRATISKNINLYDCVGTTVATLSITQEGNPEASIPQLGSDGQAIVANIARQITQAYGKYNIIEQSYHFNPLKLSDKIYTLSPIPLSVNNPDIESAWSYFYTAIRDILQLKDVDSSHLNIYQHYCNLLLANIYYSMVVVWGDVPYFKDFQQIENMIDSPASRTPQNTILADLENMLLEAIESLDEKHNSPLKDANSFFFASKDAARITLANIYMYSNRHSEAIPLIQRVIENGFYSLSNDDFADGENTSTFDSLFEEDELIYGFKNGNGTRANIIIRIPGIIALQTITDAHLSLAECYLKSNDGVKAEELINLVATTKNLTPTGNALNKIYELRSQILLYSAGYFPYMKRSGLAKDIFEVEEWQLLWPIPSSEIMLNPNITQNDGY